MEKRQPQMTMSRGSRGSLDCEFASLLTTKATQSHLQLGRDRWKGPEGRHSETSVYPGLRLPSHSCRHFPCDLGSQSPCLANELPRLDMGIATVWYLSFGSITVKCSKGRFALQPQEPHFSCQQSSSSLCRSHTLIRAELTICLFQHNPKA